MATIQVSSSWEILRKTSQETPRTGSGSSVVAAFFKTMAETVAEIRRLKGHASSVLCCVATVRSGVVASGGQDGRVCIFDLRSNACTQMQQSFEGLAVAALCFNPGNEDIFYAAAGSSVHCFDLRLGSSCRELAKYDFNEDDINQLAVNRKATYLAASDDSGETKIIDLQSQKMYKTLRGGHTNICSSVQFHPQRPWEVVTGGLDSKIIKWDFSRGKPLVVIDVGGTIAASEQVFNPPFVHALACQEREFSGDVGRLLAVARGDCGVDVYDMNFQAHKKEKGKKIAAETGGRKCHFSTENGGHAASVSHVTFARFGECGKLIISGGNDAHIRVWDWTACEQPEGRPLRLALNHGKKVNWLTTTSNATENLIVADTSKFLSIYSVQG